MKMFSKLCLMFLSVVIIGCAHQQAQNQPNNMSNSQAMKSSKAPLSDAAITTKVKSQFISDDVFTNKDVASMSIHVETVNGVVYLTGTANNRAQIRHAIATAKKVEGVKRVVSKVRVQRS
ncbi:MAG TPA: BON domain-containing protein [Gammaproteobacteria bacterium]|nr:BON domain-containing protein [Gammaproteobacteria bacterium]